MKRIFIILFCLYSIQLFSQERMYFSENFSNNDFGWIVKSTDSYVTEVKDGTYIIKHISDSEYWRFWANQSYYANDDLRIITSIKQVAGDQYDDYGLYFGSDGNNTQLLVNSSGQFKIKHDDTTIKSGALASIKPQNDYNKFEIRKKGVTYTFLVNDEEVFKSDDTDFFGGRTGFITYDKTTIAVDYMEVYREPQPFEFYETFDNNSNGWPLDGENLYKNTVESGHYNIVYKEKSSGRMFFNTINNFSGYSNFYVETRFKFLSTKDNDGFGIYMTNGENDRRYFFVESAGSFRYSVKEDEDTYYSPKMGKSPVPFSTSGEYVKLKMERKENWMYLSINDQLFDSLTYTKFTGNKIGFVVYEPIKVQVDYLKVKSTPREINVIENAIKGYKKKNLGPNVNTKHEELGPVISADGNLLFFFREGDPEIERIWGKDNQDIYYSERLADGNWSKAVNIGKPLNNSSPNFVVSITPDKNSILVANAYAEDGTPDGPGISISHRTMSGWSVPEKQEIENYYNDNDYVSYELSPDRRVMIMAVERKDTYGEKDFYVSFLSGDNSWTEPVHMGPMINTIGNEFSPFMAADGKTLYFASDGHPGYGSSDIFVAKRLDDTWVNWSKPKNMGPEINSPDWDAYFRIPASGEYAYLVSSENSIGNEDIFVIDLPDEARPDPVVLIKGKVLNLKTKEPIGTTIKYYELSTNKEAGLASSDPESGDYKIALPFGKAYSFLAEKKGFYAVSENIDLTDLEEYTEIERDLYLAPIEKGEIIRLNNIFFETAQSELLPDSYFELGRLIKILEDQPSLKIEIAGHTDSDGDDAYNLNLSNLRAASVITYLKSKGVSADRLIAKGYGESKPVATNDTDVGRQQNRRVEFIVLEE